MNEEQKPVVTSQYQKSSIMPQEAITIPSEWEALVDALQSTELITTFTRVNLTEAFVSKLVTSMVNILNDHQFLKNNGDPENKMYAVGIAYHQHYLALKLINDHIQLENVGKLLNSIPPLPIQITSSTTDHEFLLTYQEINYLIDCNTYPNYESRYAFLNLAKAYVTAK